jgi:hypothetical protein
MSLLPQLLHIARGLLQGESPDTRLVVLPAATYRYPRTCFYLGDHCRHVLKHGLGMLMISCVLSRVLIHCLMLIMKHYENLNMCDACVQKRGHFVTGSAPSPFAHLRTPLRFTSGTKHLKYHMKTAAVTFDILFVGALCHTSFQWSDAPVCPACVVATGCKKLLPCTGNSDFPVISCRFKAVGSPLGSPSASAVSKSRRIC